MIENNFHLELFYLDLKMKATCSLEEHEGRLFIYAHDRKLAIVGNTLKECVFFMDGGFTIHQFTALKKCCKEIIISQRRKLFEENKIAAVDLIHTLRGCGLIKREKQYKVVTKYYTELGVVTVNGHYEVSLNKQKTDAHQLRVDTQANWDRRL